MRCGHDTGPDPLGAPHPHDEVADVRGDADQVAGREAERVGIGWVHPQRVAVADLIQVLGVSLTGYG